VCPPPPIKIRYSIYNPPIGSQRILHNLRHVTRLAARTDEYATQPHILPLCKKLFPLKGSDVLCENRNSFSNSLIVYDETSEGSNCGVFVPKILRLSEALHHVTGPPLPWVRPSEVSVQESGPGSATDYVSGVK